jgi:hypothetical protein
MANENVNIVIKAVDKSKSALNGVQKGLGAVKSAVFSLQGALLGLGAGAAVKSIITVASEVESLQIRLKFLTGSTEDAAKAFDTMNKFAAKVPFSLEDIERASPSLLTVADNVDELNNLLAITGDIAAVSGLAFDETAMQLQRAMSAGIASADLFRDRGVSAFLGFQSGVSVSAAETKKRINEMWRDGTTTAVGATKDLSKSFMGQVSMMEDAWRELKLVIADAGVFEEAGKIIVNMTAALKDPKFKEGVKVFSKSLLSLFKFMVENKDALILLGSIYLGAKIGKAFGVIGMAVGAATGAFIAFNKEIKEFFGFAETNQVEVLNEKIAATLFQISQVQAASFGFGTENSQLKELNRSLDEYQLKLNIINEEMLMSQPLPKPANPIDVSSTGVAKVDMTGELTKAQELFQLQEQYGYLEQGRQATHNQAIKDAAEAQASWVYEHNSGKESIEAGLAQAHQNKMLEMTHLYLQKQSAMKKAAAANDIDTLQESGTKVVGALKGQYKWAFDLHKSFAIKDALIDTYKAVSTAMSSAPPPLNYGLAAVALAQGVANVQMLRSTQFREKGGPISAGSPYIVGERGPELIVPRQAGNVVPNDQLGGSNITFNIQANDTRGFDQLLQQRRGQIIGMINQAMNDRGQRAIA